MTHMVAYHSYCWDTVLKNIFKFKADFWEIGERQDALNVHRLFSSCTDSVPLGKTKNDKCIELVVSHSTQACSSSDKFTVALV